MIFLLQILNLVSILLVLLAKAENIRKVAFNCSLVLFLFSLFFFYFYDNFSSLYQFQFFLVWNSFLNINYSVGVDGISLYFVILTTFLTPFCILLSWVGVVYRVREFLVCLLVVEFFLINVFCVLDLFFFYIFFESILIPMFIMIGIWGSRRRKIHASYQFFLYTLLGSLLMLLAVIYIYITIGTTDLCVLNMVVFNFNTQLVLWFCFFLSFAVKIPMLPVHIWLPEAHVEAPTTGSVILAGLLLKMGGYAFLRYLIPLFPHASVFFMPLVFTMSVLAIIYSSLTTIRQLDLKKIIAYSSVAHMNYVTIGVFTYELQGVSGSIFLMLSHGLVSSALFICVGILYDRYHTRILKYYGGLVQLMPLYAVFFFIFSLANMSFPGTSGFIGELLILLSMFSINSVLSLYAGIGTVLGGVYVIWLYNRLFFGVLRDQCLKHYADLNWREYCCLFPLAFLIFFFGIYPNYVFNYINYSSLYFLEIVQI